jgi:transcriptional regulator with XRE-family HTH domain
MSAANDQFRNKFRYYLRRSGYNQRELAHELNVDASTLSKWVNGDNPWPVDALTQVCELLDLDRDAAQELSILAGLGSPTSPSSPTASVAPAPPSSA